MNRDLKSMSIEELDALKKTLMTQNLMVGLIGSTAGLVYANRTGGGFWRYVGYWIAGGFVVGVLPRMFYFVPQQNKVDAEIITRKEQEKLANIQTKQEIEKKQATKVAGILGRGALGLNFDGDELVF